MPNEQAPKEEPQEEQKVLVPTSAEEWGKQEVPEEEGFVTELPTGNVAKVRRTLDLPTLLRSGRIPNPLAAVVQRMIDQQTAQFPLDEIDGRMLQQLMDLLDDTCVRVMVSPKVDRPIPRGKDPQVGKDETWEQYLERITEWKPKKGSISVFDVDVNDKLYLFALAQGAAADLASFRAEQSGSLAHVQAGEDVGSAPSKPRRVAPTPNRAQRRTAKKATGRTTKR